MKKILAFFVLAGLLAAGCGGGRGTGKDNPLHDKIITLCVNDFADMAQRGQVRVIDVRTRTEYNEGHIAGAENIDVNQPDFIERLRLKADVAVYCRSGKRSQRAAALMAAEGYTVYELGGGFDAWQQAGKPSVGQGR